MKIKYQEKGYGNMSGSSLLRQMQNEHTASLDLLIRESLQNSLDAALPDSVSVSVEITDGIFQTEYLSPFFQGIDEQMKINFPGEQQFLAFRDSGTSGLTGPLSLSDIEGSKFGNLQKLIYQIAKAQENEGSGGSWGIGKTVYFRVGKGFVIYYSRIFNEETQKYEERMAATLVEDEERPVLLTENIHNTGIAWWGTPDPKLPEKDGTIPLVDDPEIHEILDIFELEPFSDDQTGTVIILPFINSEALLQQTLTEMEISHESPIPYWKTSLSEYLTVAVQKWYAPRLDNRDYPGSYLECSVNGSPLKFRDFLPLFRLVQTLYNNSLESPQIFCGRKVESEQIMLRDAFNTRIGGASAGMLSFLKVSDRDMEMDPPENLLSPYADIDQDEAEILHEPILAYARKPGMIVSYETGTDWTHSMPKTEPDEFVVAVFRSSQQTILADKYVYRNIQTLEDYLRKSENADHMSWNDVNLGTQKPSIVRKLRQNIKNKISARYKEEKVSAGKKQNIGLGRKLGSQLLPPEGSNYWDARVGGTDGPGGQGGSLPPGSDDTGSRGTGRTEFRMILDGNPEYFDREVRVPVILSFGKENQAELSIYIRTETGKTTAENWNKLVGTPFPACLNELKVLNIRHGSFRKKLKKKENRKEKTKQENSGVWVSCSQTLEGIDFEFLRGADTDNVTSILFRLPDRDSYLIEAIISYTVKGFEGQLDFHRTGTTGKGEK